MWLVLVFCLVGWSALFRDLLVTAFCCFIPETAGHSLEVRISQFSYLNAAFEPAILFHPQDMDVAFGDSGKDSEQDKERMARINAEIGYDRYLLQKAQ